MANTPTENPEKREGAVSKPWYKRLAEYTRDGVRALFSTRIPNDLKERGLTDEVFKEFEAAFYAKMKENESDDVSIIRRRAAEGKTGHVAAFGEALTASGWYAQDQRSEAVLKILIDDSGFQNDPEICDFLEKRFLRQPPELG